MSTTRRQTDLTASEQPRYTDARIVRGPDQEELRVRLSIGRITIDASGLAAVVVVAALPAGALFAASVRLHADKYFTLVLTVIVYLVTLALLLSKIRRLPAQMIAETSLAADDAGSAAPGEPGGDPAEPT